MKNRKKTIHEMLAKIDELLEAISQQEQRYEKALSRVAPEYKNSAYNLVHYEALRSVDLRTMQKRSRNLGLSRLANAEGHVLASVINKKRILSRLFGKGQKEKLKANLSIKKGRRLLIRHTKELLGYRSKGRRVRIMVTQPTEAAFNYAMVQQMVLYGMNCARINCAHDSPEIWEKMIVNIRRASKAAGKVVKIAMDLAGPKIRTGRMQPGPKIRKFTPLKDVTGLIINPAEIIFVDKMDEFSPPNSLLLTAQHFRALRVGDTFELIDTRHKRRKIKIIAKREKEVLAYCYETSYIGTGSILRCTNRDLMEMAIDELPPIEQSIILHVDDRLLVVRKDIEGVPATYDEDGNIQQIAKISCQLPAVFDQVKSGQRIIFDDGKIEGLILKVKKDYLDVKITHAKENGSKLKAEKGMNFPDSTLEVPSLTKKDMVDLAFVAKHADIVNFSFVHSKEDVKQLHEQLRKHGVLHKLGVILKIETRAAFDNLVEILLTAMEAKGVGVMIARGDLAVETGWNNIAKVQEEILRVCSAGHIPVVWATQVLENLSKKGLPSRAEITDAASSLKAECVMLNKGSHINRAIGLLHSMLSDLEMFHEKKEVMLPKKERFW